MPWHPFLSFSTVKHMSTTQVQPSALPRAVFNSNKTDYESTAIVLGQQGGVFDSIHNHHPRLNTLFENLRSLDWAETEFPFEDCQVDFERVEYGIHHAMLENLAYQWETDTVAAGIIPRILSVVITNSAARRQYIRIADNENLHAATYSAIIHHSFGERSKEVLKYALSIKETYERLDTVTKVYEDTRRMINAYEDGLIPNDQALYNQCLLFLFTLLVMERVQFMTSFSMTFAIVDTGVFGAIGDAVQKICQDEFENHIPTHTYVLGHELASERGQIALPSIRKQMAAVLNEVVASEQAWADFTFRDGRRIPGITRETSFAWARFSATDLVRKFSLADLVDFETLTENPLPFMAEWINISLVQASPQEEDGNQYKINVISRDDSAVDLDLDLL